MEPCLVAIPGRQAGTPWWIFSSISTTFSSQVFENHGYRCQPLRHLDSTKWSLAMTISPLGRSAWCKDIVPLWRHSRAGLKERRVRPDLVKWLLFKESSVHVSGVTSTFVVRSCTPIPGLLLSLDCTVIILRVYQHGSFILRATRWCLPMQDCMQELSGRVLRQNKLASY